MRFYRAFLRMLLWRPRQACTALYWHLTGRRVRARNLLRLGSAQSPRAYALWIKTIEREAEARAMARTPDTVGEMMRAPSGWPRLSVILHYHSNARPSQFARTIASLAAQSYRDWELVLVLSDDIQPQLAADVPRLTLAPGRATSPDQALALGISSATGEYVLPLPADAVLPPTALLHYAEGLDRHPQAAVVFGDHDTIDSRQRRAHPWFKPEWNPEMFLAQDYISPACLIRTDAALRALPIAPALADAACYALLLAVSAEAGERIIHIPWVLCHLQTTVDTEPEASALHPGNQAARMAAVTHQLADTGATARPGPFGTVTVDWPLPQTLPLVSIIIPTRDHAKLLRTCVLGVLDATRYRPIEVIIVDNGSSEAETLTYLERIAKNPRVRVIRDDAPFNYSALNNRAVAEARGDYICLLNNDIDIIDDGWLTALMRQAIRPGVGAVGAKLLYEDGSIQHAGVVIGLGDAAGHAHRFQRNDDAGYFAQAHVAHQASAVTGACLVVEKAKFLAVGGLDEAALAVAFNDVDLCLKLQQAGWRNIYVPQAVLIHHESKSRGRDMLPANVERFKGELAVLQERWATKTCRDPLHHPHLERGSETYLLRLRFLRAARPNVWSRASKMLIFRDKMGSG